jgi:hypothetical protein
MNSRLLGLGEVRRILLLLTSVTVNTPRGLVLMRYRWFVDSRETVRLRLRRTQFMVEFERIYGDRVNLFGAILGRISRPNKLPLYGIRLYTSEHERRTKYGAI